MRIYIAILIGIMASDTICATCDQETQQARVAPSTTERSAYMYTLMPSPSMAQDARKTSDQTPWSPASSKQTSAQTMHTTSTPVSLNHVRDYISTVNHWRVQMGLAILSSDSKLESNALNTVMAGNGVMIHKLNPGTFAQVLAPGVADDFDKIFVGGWLCEKPGLPGLNGVCAMLSQGWAYNGQTGHADILTSESYTKIGCAFYTGIWCCDLA